MAPVTNNNLTPQERDSVEKAALDNIITDIPHIIDNDGQGWTLYIMCNYCGYCVMDVQWMINHPDPGSVGCPNCGPIYLSETHVQYWADPCQ